MLVKAELKNYRQSSRKVRLVADLVRGKKVSTALAELSFLNKKAAPVVKKLIDSAIANAKHNFNLEKDNLIVKEIRVDEGKTLKRWRAGARGRAFPLKKRTSRVLLALESKDDEKTVKKEMIKKDEVKKVSSEKKVDIKKEEKKVVKK
ncbi:50S ribosomal protein L22 [Patescibacteria group bacterium]|nr:50S ribosomal protein L22 [Patescibacteria group bacterium]